MINLTKKTTKTNITLQELQNFLQPYYKAIIKNELYHTKTPQEQLLIDIDEIKLGLTTNLTRYTNKNNTYIIVVNDRNSVICEKYHRALLEYMNVILNPSVGFIINKIQNKKTKEFEYSIQVIANIEKQTNNLIKYKIENPKAS